MKKLYQKYKVFIVVVFIILLGILISINILDGEEKQNSIDSEGINTIEELLKEEGIEIETSIATLYYPQKWENKLRIEKRTDEVESISFWGVVEGKKEKKIFEIVYGKADGILLGKIKEKEIYLVYSELDFNGSWNKEEQNVIYRMQEDVNYTIGKLYEEKEFVLAE